MNGSNRLELLLESRIFKCPDAPGSSGTTALKATDCIPPGIEGLQYPLAHNRITTGVGALRNNYGVTAFQHQGCIHYAPNGSQKKQIEQNREEPTWIGPIDTLVFIAKLFGVNGFYCKAFWNCLQLFAQTGYSNMQKVCYVMCESNGSKKAYSICSLMTFCSYFCVLDRPTGPTTADWYRDCRVMW